MPRGNSRAAAAGAWRGGVAWRLARVFFRDERDERDAETTENSKVCALKRCRWRVYFLETKETQRPQRTVRFVR